MGQLYLFDNGAKSSEPSGLNVYCIQLGDRVKIGVARDVLSRFRQLQTAAPGRLRLVAYRPGTLADEKRLHAECAHDKVSGEWFQATTNVKASITMFFRAFEWRSIAAALLEFSDQDVRWARTDGCTPEESELIKAAWRTVYQRRMAERLSELAASIFGHAVPVEQLLVRVSSLRRETEETWQALPWPRLPEGTYFSIDRCGRLTYENDASFNNVLH